MEYTQAAELCSCLQSDDGRLMLSLGGIPRQETNPTTPTEGVALSQDGRSCYFFEDATLMTIGESYACSAAQFRAFGVQYVRTAVECTCLREENGKLMLSYGQGSRNTPRSRDKEGVSLSQDKSRCFFHEDSSLLIVGQPGACSPAVFRAFNQPYNGQTECVCNYDEKTGQIQLEYASADSGGRGDNYDDSRVQLSRNGQRCIFDDNTQFIVGEPSLCSLAVFRGFGKEDDFTGQEIDCVCEVQGNNSLHLSYRTRPTQRRGNHGRKRRYRRLRRV
ncbi:uncharacterized protein LOC111710785 isoform X2 [Eurytemora carolleeae]|uniref:uncharacterized protein LOC111710785 isoform X2 n=1 Tax=Eurytemora carolleeae TaxID=1294199 RepID=UPI000C75AEC6|nr:uncharacterized protein LOC111710785 isoform X2 [Eurytemora carolleeae]|eukprot:XP_023340687.1 uncharacterized protein LOC111710785 isoform X2 [Eurytemora affinis]